MYSCNISSDIWNFLRHLINYCLLISVILLTPQYFLRETGVPRNTSWESTTAARAFFLSSNYEKITGREGRSEIPPEFSVTVFRPVIIFLIVETAKIEGNTVTDLHAKQRHE
jgi:hypothetical protein